MRYRITKKRLTLDMARFLGVPFSWSSAGSIYRYEDQGSRLYIEYKNKWRLLNKEEKEQVERDLFEDWMMCRDIFEYRMMYLAEEVGGSDEISSDG